MLKQPIQFNEKSIPLLIGFLAILSYGGMLFETGFYWDDWPFVWIAQFLGPFRFIEAFWRVRPFLGPIFLVTTSLMPETPLAWQTLAIFIRFLISLSAWWSFQKIWPNHTLKNLFLALVFLIYPGYSQHWVAFTHINQELIPFIFYTLSFGFTGITLRANTKKYLYTFSGLLFLIFGVFPTEYFISIEPLRFFFIFSVLNETNNSLKATFFKAIKTWFPYVTIWSLNALWIYFYYTSGVYSNYDIAVKEISPSTNSLLANGYITSIEALYKAGVLAWIQFFQLVSQNLQAPSTWLALFNTSFSFLILMIFFHQFKSQMLASNSRQWALQAIIIGIIGIIIGRIPSWAAGLPLTLQSSFDRFTISMLPGAALLITGLITLLFQHQNLWKILVSLLIAFGVGQQTYNASIFRRDWQRQTEFYWQMAWRIPALEPETLLLTNELEMDYETDYSISAPINWIYSPQFKSTKLPYLVLNESRFNNTYLPSLKANQNFSFSYRPIQFTGNTSNSVVFLFPINGCLRILDPAFNDQLAYNTKLSQSLKTAVEFSNPKRILTNKPDLQLQEELFGKEPSHTWCYYYTKAELARQEQDWDKIILLDQQARQLNFSSDDPIEWLPFIEAYVRTNHTDFAAELTKQAIQKKSSLYKSLCALWKRSINPSSSKEIYFFIDEQVCKPNSFKDE